MGGSVAEKRNDEHSQTRSWQRESPEQNKLSKFGSGSPSLGKGPKENQIENLHFSNGVLAMNQTIDEDPYFVAAAGVPAMRRMRIYADVHVATGAGRMHLISVLDQETIEKQQPGLCRHTQSILDERPEDQRKMKAIEIFESTSEMQKVAQLYAVKWLQGPVLSPCDKPGSKTVITGGRPEPQHRLFALA
jgi:hypothetical protein